MPPNQHIPERRVSAPPSTPPLAAEMDYAGGPAGPPNHAAVAGVITAICLLGGVGSWMLLSPSNDAKNDDAGQPPLMVPIEPVVDAGSTPDRTVTIAEEAAMPPTTVLKDLIRGVLSRDVDQITDLGIDLDPDAKASLAQALENRQITIDSQKPVNDLGPIDGGLHRWGINVQRSADKTTGQLLVDLGPDGQGGWMTQRLTLPDYLASPPANREVIELAAVFLDHLIEQNFDALGEITAKDAVPNEKLAALGLMFQEGEFQPIKERAFRTTNVTDDRAWIIAKVESVPYHLQSEIGLELKKEAADQPWIIERVNVSTLMNAFLNVSKDQDTLKVPLIENPRGGESVVLYFGYDSDQLTQRSLKQLAVIASILKLRGSSEIQIAGHTDSLGEDPYNDALSQRRAREVATTLRSLGVRQRQIKLESFGERVPLRPNLRPDGSDNPEGRQRNRRAEIYLDF